MNNEINKLDTLYQNLLHECNSLEQNKVINPDIEDRIIKLENLAQSIFLSLDETRPRVRNLRANWKVLENRLNRILFRFNKSLFVQAGSYTDIVASNRVQFQSKNKSSSLSALDRATALLKILLPSIIKKAVKRCNQQLFVGYNNKKRLQINYKKLEELLLQKTDITDRIQKESDQVLKERLKTQLNTNSTKIDEIKKQIEIAEANELTGQRTRANFERLGGERIELVTSDQVKLDSMFLDSNKFKEAIKAHGGQFAKISFMPKKSKGLERLEQNEENKKDETIKEVEAIVFKSFTQANEILETLNDLGMTGWSTVLHNGQLFLINDEFTNQFNKKADDQLFKINIRKPSFFLVKDSLHVTVKTMDLDATQKSNGGTVILSSGASGVYEMHKNEAMFFLLKGMNVMLFNFRGYGLSEGKPSQKGFDEDLETVYEFCKSKTNQDDSKFLFKAICLSGGSAAKIAGLHPNTNVFLDQTYSSFSKLMEDVAIKEIKKYIQMQENKIHQNEKDKLSLRIIKYLTQNWSYFIKFFVKTVGPSFEVAENLAKNNGKKALFFVIDDDLISQDHVETMMRSLSREGKLDQMTVFSSASGKHGSSWVNLLNSPASFETKFKEISSIQEQVDKEVTSLNEELKRINQNVNTAKQKFIESKPETRHELLDIYNEEVKNSEVKSREILAKIKNIQHDAKVKIEEIRRKFDPNDLVFSNTVQSQMKHFLSKAQLSDDILKGQ